MKAKPHSIVWKITRRNYGHPLQIARLPVLRETDNHLFLDKGLIHAKLDKRSEHDMRDVFATREAAELRLRELRILEAREKVAARKRHLAAAKKQVKRCQAELDAAKASLERMRGS